MGVQMASKLKSMAKSDENALVESVCRSAHQIWQAGLGAFSKAQEEGSDVFNKLAQEGAELQKRTRQLAGDKVFGMTDTVSKLAENVSKQASGSFEKLEKIFEDRVSRSLRSLGVPTQSDIKALSKQIDELHKSINAMAGKQVAEKAAPKKRAAKAAEKVPAKRAVKRSTMKTPVTAGAKKSTRVAVSHA
jgi:poly(hydroxyalkanoate) granule-associated protein